VSLPVWFDRLLGWFVPERGDAAEVRRRKIVVGLTLAIAASSPAYATLYAIALRPPYGQIAIAGGVLATALMAAVPFLLRSGAPVSVCVALFAAGFSGLMLLTASLTGGYDSPVLPWLVVLPLLGLGLGGMRLAWLLNGLVVAQLALLASVPSPWPPATELLSPGGHDVLWATTLVSITFAMFLVGWIYEALKNQTIRDLERANQAKSDFLAHVSHELRTPMTAILGFAEMLEEVRLAPAQLEDVRTIRRNGEHLLAVINDILDLSRVESGRLELSLGPVRPDAVLAEVAALVRPRALERGLELHVDVGPGADVPIRSDPTRLAQIVINLAGNAVKFTESGHVRLRVSREGAHVRFEVEDSGPGIPAGKQEQIFEAFTQGDASMSRRYGGTGLGLAISRRLARLLDGDLGVRSEPGRGSVFFLSIPAARAEGETGRADGEASPASEPPLRGRVLLAEDGADSRRLVRHLLERWGLTVETAEDGAAALARALEARDRDEPFDVVLMDMQMPVMDGYEATRRLRAAGFPGAIIAITAHAMQGARERCLDAGCDEYVTKPIDRPRLRGLLASYLKGP
jgi:signal transduction histidine kinase